MQNLRNALLRDTKSFRECHNGLTFGITFAYPTIAFVLTECVICKGKIGGFLTNIHKQHPVIEGVHKMLESPGS